MTSKEFLSLKPGQRICTDLKPGLFCGMVLGTPKREYTYIFPFNLIDKVNDYRNNQYEVVIQYGKKLSKQRVIKEQECGDWELLDDIDTLAILIDTATKIIGVPQYDISGNPNWEFLFDSYGNHEGQIRRNSDAETFHFRLVYEKKYTWSVG